MKLEMLVPMKGMTEFEWRTRQAHKLELAIAQATNKADKRAYERQAKRLAVKIQALKDA
jgi:hypothetical protein